MTMTYKNQAHMKIYRHYVLLSPYRHTNEFLAAVYLLSADKELWFRAKKAIDGKNIIFDQIDKKELSCYSYTLYRLAQDFYEGMQHIGLHDIGDTYLISDKTCALIINAINVCREGYDAIGINKRFN